MSRLRRIADRDRIFFITTNLAAGTAPLNPSECDLILAQLGLQRSAWDFCIFGYVVMPTHVHLLLTPDRVGLIAIMNTLKRFTAQRIAANRQVRKPIWQPRYFDFILRRTGDFWDKLEYIHNNPVEAGLTGSATAWPWSSANQYVSGSPSTARLTIDPIRLPTDRNALLYPARWR